jgi:D-lactate dehydrogenase
MKIAFFETEDWEAEYLKSKLLGHELLFSSGRIDKDNLPEITDFDILSVFTGSKIDQSLLDNLPGLKFIATRTTGYDHIDLAAANNKGIVTSNVPSYGENTVAEHAFGLLLSVSRKIYQSFDRIRETGSFNQEGLQGFDLKGKTIGVVGTGRIGQYSIKIANGFGMNVIAYDAFPKSGLDAELNFKYVSFEELLKTSDVITLHVPLLPETTHMINQETLKLVKKGCILINTARGAVIDTTALIEALNNGNLGGAGLDVLEEEVPTQDERQFLLYGRPEEHDLKIILENHVLIDMDNVVLTPHNAFNTKEALQRILNTTAENISQFIAGTPQNLVK